MRLNLPSYSSECLGAHVLREVTTPVVSNHVVLDSPATAVKQNGHSGAAYLLGKRGHLLLVWARAQSTRRERQVPFTLCIFTKTGSTCLVLLAVKASGAKPKIGARERATTKVEVDKDFIEALGLAL